MKSRRVVLLALLLAAALAAGLFVFFKPAASKRSFVLGVIGNFKGKNAQAGIEAFNAIMLAYDDYKKSHPKGFDLAILPTDYSWVAEKARPAYLDCADQSDLLILLISSSHVMLLREDMLARPHIVHALLGPTTTRLSGLADNAIRNVADLAAEQRQIAAFADSRGIQSLLVAIENDFNPGYTEPAAEAFLKYTHIPKIDVVRFSGHKMDTDAVKDLLATNRYDAFYAMVGGMPREAAILIQQARAIQPGIPVFITPWIRGMIFDQALGPENNGIFLPSHVKLRDNPAFDRMSATYRDMFHADSQEYFNPLMYDLASSLFDALDHAPSPATADLLPRLLSRQYQGIAGPFGYDACGDAVGQMHFHLLSNGVWNFVTSVPPATGPAAP